MFIWDVLQKSGCQNLYLHSRRGEQFWETKTRCNHRRFICFSSAWSGASLIRRHAGLSDHLTQAHGFGSDQAAELISCAADYGRAQRFPFLAELWRFKDGIQRAV